MSEKTAAVLVVLIRDIARAEREGRATPEYLQSAAEILAAADDPAPARLPYLDPE